MEEKSKKRIIASVIAAAGLLAIIGTSFAFLVANIGTLAQSSLEINTTTLDSLVYQPGSPISITPNQTNFAPGQPNIVRYSNSTVTLSVNNMESSSYCYTVDLVVSSNTFVHTVDNSTPEIVFTISKSINGGSASNILTNYDITSLTGTLHIPISSGSSTLKHTISGSANATVVHTFNVTVEMKNLETNQNANESAQLNSQLVLQTVSC